MTEDLHISDVGRVKSDAATITQAGATFHSTWQGIKADINSIHSLRPWGNDSAGQAFLQGYGDPTGQSQGLKNKDGADINGANSPAAKIIANTDDLANRIKDVGPGITNFVNGVVDDDELIASWFKT